MRHTRSRLGRTAPTLLLTAALALTVSAGCKHHSRTVMRPVYGAPVIAPAAAAPCPSGNCGGSVGASAATISPGFDEGGLTPAPSSSPPPSARPIAPSKAGATGEPDLLPITPTSKDEPPLIIPRTSRRNRGLGIFPRRTALQQDVTPFVDDAGDLFTPPKADRPWKYVVLHHSAAPSGGYAQIDRDHRKVRGYNGCGYHFVIGNGTESPDGQIEVAQRWSDQKGGAHCRDGKTADVNEYGIGICLVGDFDHAPPTPKQVAAARALVAYLQDRYTIDPEHVGTHTHLASGHVACPGRQFPTDLVLAADSDSAVAPR